MDVLFKNKGTEIGFDVSTSNISALWLSSSWACPDS